MRNSSSAQLSERQKQSRASLEAVGWSLDGNTSWGCRNQSAERDAALRVAEQCHWLSIHASVWCRRWSQLCALLEQRSTPSAVGAGIVCEHLAASSVIPQSPEGQLCPAVCTQMWVSWNVKWCFHSQLGLESSW